MEAALGGALRVLGGAVRHEAGRVALVRPQALRGDAMDRLVRMAVFGAGDDERDAARWLIWELAQEAGCPPASIHDLYMARGRGECGGFTVPAMNVRVMAYDTARAIFRAAMPRKAGALILEIARSEMSYTDQRPAEYASVMLAAAMREGFRGPVFIQGDHFQVNAKKFADAPEKEVGAIRMLIDEALAAGFYNIDIDTSTLVNLEHDTLEAQQRENFERAAALTQHIREGEPEGVTVSVGGEIGEVGGKNSTVDELRAFMNGYRTALARRGDYDGLSKISVQTGTAHGGVVLPDGSIAEVKLDLDALRELSRVATEEYGLAGGGAQGGSPLPPQPFGKFPKNGGGGNQLPTNIQKNSIGRTARWGKKENLGVAGSFKKKKKNDECRKEV